MLAGSNICKEQYPVQIMHCGTFFLYNLSRPNSCDIAYCFGVLSYIFFFTCFSLFKIILKDGLVIIIAFVFL